MRHWESLVDRLVKEAIGDGNISHLPGAGKPLKLDDDMYTPDHMRLAFKMMQDNDVAPEWMMMGKVLEEREDKFRKQISIRADRYIRELAKIQRKGHLIKEEQIENDWQRYIEEFTEKVKKHNKEVLLYNLKVPASIPHKQILSSEKLIISALSNQEGDD